MPRFEFLKNVFLSNSNYLRQKNGGFAPVHTEKLLFVFSAHRNYYSTTPIGENPSHLWDEYKRVKDMLGDPPVSTPLINAKAVFANNELQLRSIDVYGFDYDYTLAVYKKDVNNLIYELGRQRLIKDFKYPAALTEMTYDPLFAVRGLHFDVPRCILLKLDAYCQVQAGTAYRGKTKLTDEEVKRTYNGFYVPSNYIQSESGEERMKQLNDLFSLPEIGLLTNVVEYFQRNHIEFDTNSMFHDVQAAIRQVHFSGQLYHAVGSNVDRYIHKNPGLLTFFERLNKAKKTVFIVTNSPFSFIDVGMKYLLGGDWRRFFNYIIVQARKPHFFKNCQKPFRLYREETNGLSWEKVTELKPNFVYAEGNLEEFLVKSSIGSKSVLYFGDHVYSDLADPMLKLGWRTGGIVPELEREIETQNTELYRSSIAWLVTITWLIERNEDAARGKSESDAVIKSWYDERTALMQRLKSMFNPQFGSIFRTFHHPTYFSRRLMRLADVYTSRLPNLLQYSLEHTFYPRRFALPHEAHYGVPLGALDSTVCHAASSTGM